MGLALTLVTTSTIQNSKVFIEVVEGEYLSEDEMMVSYDVEALYTSLPIERVLDVVKDRLLEDPTFGERTPLDVHSIIHFLRFCLTSTYFSFQDNFYHLTDGLAMGSPVSSVVANMLMENSESKALDSAA